LTRLSCQDLYTRTPRNISCNRQGGPVPENLPQHLRAGALIPFGTSTSIERIEHLFSWTQAKLTPILTRLLLCLLLCAAGYLNAQTTISGYFTDADSGEPLLSANVIDLNTGQGALANTYGFYSLTLPTEADSARLRFSYIGYQNQEITIALKENMTLNIPLSPSVDLAEVVVTSDRGERIEQQTQMSRTEIPVAQIKRIPALLGEVDVLKTLQLLPGVQSGGEGSTGLYVRGGSPDQNLVLLDGVPIYNVSHVLGIFSVFNADALRNVTLTKGGFPARFGGRLSSVLEINMKEGNLNEWEGEGSIGLISSKLTLSGPIQKGKSLSQQLVLMAMRLT